MGISFWIILVAGFAGLILFVGLIIAVIVIAIRGFTKNSGMNAMAAQYPAMKEPANAWRWQTAKIGAIQYRRCLTVAVVDAGLYLSAKLFLTAPQSALIPWSQIRLVGAGRLYWKPTRRISIGNPQVAVIEVFENLWQQIAPHLAPVSLQTNSR